ncbi:hypothetical protein FEM48_Zijuj03G0026500 [Ziziphus jujuba var. spinosa]|uniref:Enhancer of polycomb-like protein n=1 Tax=Ziziphus jujuba var. spinosa TaxID=714518 RepID=A0A978VMP1_ZIZJJ|nr:hypothetical protein FEM48_Zijuj03G0026500 [Ziziphus jujuba var. spinosa]
MPSVGMRRTTRVFGVVKGADGARVLRSGRRLWPDSGESKLRRSNDGDDWFKIIKSDGGGKDDNGGGGLGYEKPKPNSKPSGWTKISANGGVQKSRGSFAKADGFNSDKLFGAVYSRKRKNSVRKSSDSAADSEGKDRNGFEDKMFGLHFVRRQRRKVNGGESLVVTDNFLPQDVVSVVVDSSVAKSSWAAPFFQSILMYMKRSELRLTELSSFLMSEPINTVYSSCNIQVFWGSPPCKRSGICKFFGAMQFIPLFSVDFSAVPLFFMYMHSCMLLRYKFPPPQPLNNYAIDDDEEEEEEELFFPLPSQKDALECKAVDAEANKRCVSHPSVRTSKLVGRNSQYRNGLTSRCIQKRRSSLRRRRARNPSINSTHKSNGALVSDLISFRKRGVPFSSSVTSNIKLRRSVRRSPSGTLKEESSTAVGSTQEMDLPSCCANILVIESDKCYREEGANVVLEISPLGEWVLVVKKDGMTRFTHRAEKVMRPCCCNRFTHDIMWIGDNSWKLEFPNRQDWMRFKDLYKECSDRNTPIKTPSAKTIPVPGVSEVPGYGENLGTLFCRPDSYISVKDDEVSRALARRNANYDMDSEDEEWLKKFNGEVLVENELHEHVSEDTFEIMVDAFEKAFYCSPNDLSDEKVAANFFLDMGRREVVEALCGYWMKKRKQKRSSLLRVFQGHQVKKAPLIPKPFFRKKRSFKRQPSQLGRGKYPSYLQAEQDALEEQNAVLKVKEANASASKSMQLAVSKRQRAQILMGNADLATYRAAMALKIAEAALVANSPDDATASTAHLLD